PAPPGSAPRPRPAWTAPRSPKERGPAATHTSRRRPTPAPGRGHRKSAGPARAVASRRERGGGASPPPRRWTARALRARPAARLRVIRRAAVPLGGRGEGLGCPLVPVVLWRRAGSGVAERRLRLGGGRLGLGGRGRRHGRAAHRRGPRKQPRHRRPARRPAGG